MIASIKRRRKGIVLVLSDFRELPAAARQQMKNKELALELLPEIFSESRCRRISAVIGIRYKEFIVPVPTESMIIHELEWYRVRCLTSLSVFRDAGLFLFHRQFSCCQKTEL